MFKISARVAAARSGSAPVYTHTTVYISQATYLKVLCLVLSHRLKILEASLFVSVKV